MKTLIILFIVHFGLIKTLNGLITWNGNLAYSCDFYRNDLTSVHVPIEKCAPLCTQTAGCTHFTWTTYGSGTCWMKTGPISKKNAFFTNDNTMFCGVNSDSSIESVILWNDNNWASACDFLKKDLISLQLPADQCTLACDQTPGCTHYAWTADGICYMKTGCVTKNDAFYTNDQTMICGVTANSNVNCQINWNDDWAYGCDWHDNNLLSTQVPSYLCGRLCGQVPGCTHFTWTTADGGTCSLKTGIVSKNDAFYTSNNTMVCGVNNGSNGRGLNPSQEVNN